MRSSSVPGRCAHTTAPPGATSTGIATCTHAGPHPRAAPSGRGRPAPIPHRKHRTDRRRAKTSCLLIRAPPTQVHNSLQDRRAGHARLDRLGHRGHGARVRRVGCYLRDARQDRQEHPAEQVRREGREREDEQEPEGPLADGTVQVEGDSVAAAGAPLRGWGGLMPDEGRPVRVRSRPGPLCTRADRRSLGSVPRAWRAIRR